ncbi:hypothetical protein D3C84_488650 [compost metagenome]
MALEQIQNGETGFKAREKINAAIVVADNAASAAHDHTPEEVGAAPASHIHTAAQVNSDILAGTYGAIGAYGEMVYLAGDGAKFPGFTAPGAQLKWSSGSGLTSGGLPSGTWQLHGSISGNSDFGGYMAENVSLWIRVA